MGKNVYERAGRLYLDYIKDKKRCRVATSLKSSPLALNFIKENYDLFIDDKEKAVRLFYAYEDDLALKTMQSPINSDLNINLSLKALFERFLLEKSFLKQETKRLYQTICNKLLSLLDELEIKQISDFKREHSLLLVQILKKRGLKISTMRLYFRIFNGFLNYLINIEIIDKNLFELPKFSVSDNYSKGFEPFNLLEIENLITHAQGELRTYLILGFFTGARTGEILGLQFRDLDFDKKEIHITKSLSNRKEIGLGTPKTKTSYRVIDMLPLVENELAELLWQVNDMSEFIIKEKRATLRIHFYALQKQLGLKQRRLYDTRHSFASVMLSKGEEPMWVGVKMLGHKDLNETFRTYAKYLPKEVKERATFLKDMKF